MTVTVTFDMEDETATAEDPTIAIKDMDKDSITAALVARQPLITVATDDDPTDDSATEETTDETTDETATDEL